MNLNATHIGVDTVRGERNLTTLGFFSTGLVFELREGIEELRDLDLPSRLSAQGLQRWKQLVELSALKNSATISQLRNCMAFHIGDQRVAADGIVNLAAEKRKLVLASGDGPAKVEGRHDLGGDVILAGIRIRPPGVPKGIPNSRRRLEHADLVAALDEASENHFTVIRVLEEVFVDVLSQAGATFEPLNPFAARDTP
jgi:hypothetical protein